MNGVAQPVAIDTATDPRLQCCALIRSLIAQHLDCDAGLFTLDGRSFTDVGIDSLTRVQLTVLLEEQLRVIIKDEEAMRVSSFADLVTLVSAKLAAQGTRP